MTGFEKWLGALTVGGFLVLGAGLWHTHTELRAARRDVEATRQSMSEAGRIVNAAIPSVTETLRHYDGTVSIIQHELDAIRVEAVERVGAIRADVDRLADVVGGGGAASSAVDGATTRGSFDRRPSAGKRDDLGTEGTP